MSIALPEGMHVHSIIHAELLIRRADCLKIFGKAYERTQNVGEGLTSPYQSVVPIRYRRQFRLHCCLEELDLEKKGPMRFVQVNCY